MGNVRWESNLLTAHGNIYNFFEMKLKFVIMTNKPRAIDATRRGALLGAASAFEVQNIIGPVFDMWVALIWSLKNLYQPISI